MNLTGCGKYRSSFSAYLDGAVSGKQMQSIAQHLDGCEDCRREFDSLRSMQRSLALLGPAKAPADMGTRLRVAISHEVADRKSSWRDALAVRWDNAFRPLLVQVSAGFASSVALVGGIILLLGAVAAPTAVMANDEPLMGSMTMPHYLYSAGVPRPIITPQDTAVVVEALVNDQGRVYDYKIISGPEDKTVQIQILDQLALSVFEPARVFGAPVRGRVLLTFSGISVRA
ncbi:MAG: zf-HC2 domain-containing protein [Edaphobacter sp.]|uniref:zf-HC2 domain-containing protein n=1 Tax=Edaphobacter sp. TaxID=1934404 RepID=UPI0023A33148|nr:zf-HC2 domain-containing protein [Edaphobacter sp.]MDE1178074.1 zf-HC2 domain-containing protein [Edaphobacter sp.]